jgi:hypothetical protein
MPTEWGLPLVRGGVDGARKVVTYLPNRFHAHRHLDHSSYSLVVPPSFPPSANCTMHTGHAIFLLPPPPDRLYSVPTLILTFYYLGGLHRDYSSYPAALNGYPHSAGCHTPNNYSPQYAPHRRALFRIAVWLIRRFNCLARLQTWQKTVGKLERAQFFARTIAYCWMYGIAWQQGSVFGPYKQYGTYRQQVGATGIHTAR